jgi:uncharacterized OsmC-like protein
MMKISLIEKMKFQAECRSHKVISDQPVEDGGSDAGMAPVELLIASLGTCIGYYVTIFCQRRKISADGLKVELDWKFAENPHRVGSIEARITLPIKLDEKDRAGLLRMARGCTVHNTFESKPETRFTLT